VFVIVIFLPRQRQAVVKFFAKIAPTWEKHIEEFLNKQQDKYRGNSTVASSDTAVVCVAVRSYHHDVCRAICLFRMYGISCLDA